jgi:hypothetical protein
MTASDKPIASSQSLERMLFGTGLGGWAQLRHRRTDYYNLNTSIMLQVIHADLAMLNKPNLINRDRLIATHNQTT